METFGKNSGDELIKVKELFMGNDIQFKDKINADDVVEGADIDMEKKR